MTAHDSTEKARPLVELLPELEEVLTREQLSAIVAFAAKALKCKRLLEVEQERVQQLQAAFSSAASFLAALVLRRNHGELRIKASEVERAARTGQTQRVTCKNDADGNYILALEAIDGAECEGN